jgi:hypothetical protein
LNKRTEVKEHQDFIKPLLEGKILVWWVKDALVSQILALIVKLAHEKGIQVAFSRSFFDTFGHDGIWNERPEFYVSRLFTHWKGEKK